MIIAHSGRGKDTLVTVDSSKGFVKYKSLMCMVFMESVDSTSRDGPVYSHVYIVCHRLVMHACMLNYSYHIIL